MADLAADLGAVMDPPRHRFCPPAGSVDGGMTVLSFAESNPERVRSLTLVYTSPCPRRASRPWLPGPQRAALEAMAEAAAAPPPTTDAERIAARVEESGSSPVVGTPSTETGPSPRPRPMWSNAPHATPAHGLAVMRSPSAVDGLADITCPTLVIHGTEDPIIDIAHGRFLAAQIPGARLVELAGMSHEMPPAMCAEVIDEVLSVMA